MQIHIYGKIKVCMEMKHANLRMLNTDWVGSGERRRM